MTWLLRLFKEFRELEAKCSVQEKQLMDEMRQRQLMVMSKGMAGTANDLALAQDLLRSCPNCGIPGGFLNQHQCFGPAIYGTGIMQQKQ